nr:hypothetical protein [Microbacterium sp. Root53]
MSNRPRQKPFTNVTPRSTPSIARRASPRRCAAKEPERERRDRVERGGVLVLPWRECVQVVQARGPAREAVNQLALVHDLAGDALALADHRSVVDAAERVHDQIDAHGGAGRDLGQVHGELGAGARADQAPVGVHRDAVGDARDPQRVRGAPARHRRRRARCASLGGLGAVDVDLPSVALDRGPGGAVLPRKRGVQGRVAQRGRADADVRVGGLDGLRGGDVLVPRGGDLDAVLLEQVGAAEEGQHAHVERHRPGRAGELRPRGARAARTAASRAWSSVRRIAAPAARTVS